MKTIRRLHKRRRRLTPHVLFEIAVGKFQANLGVVWIEVGNLVENVESTFVIARLRVSIGDYEILRACIMDQALGGVEIGKLEGDDWIARSQPLDLLVHRDGFEIELLGAVMLGD